MNSALTLGEHLLHLLNLCFFLTGMSAQASVLNRNSLLQQRILVL
jgi:hypothetical protein